MKHLKIEYTTESGNTIQLFDGEVAEVVWSDSRDGVRVEGKTQSGSGMNLLDLLTGASKSRTEEVVEQKRSELAAEKESLIVPSEVVTETVEQDGIEVIQAAQT